MSNDLRVYINEHMPYIDDFLAEQNVPIPKRFFSAGRLFVYIAVMDSTFGSKKELLESDAYRECVLPLFNDWYFEKYGDLAKGSGKDFYSGIVVVYGKIVEVKIPATTSEVLEEGKLARMTFPNHLQESEKIEELIQPKFDLAKMDESSIEELKDQVAKVVGLTRSINLDLNMATNLNKLFLDMAHGIWSHFEKGILDILTLKTERSSIACWEIHLAIEKSLKVLIYSKSGKKMHGHKLDTLIKFLEKYENGIDSSKLSNLPSDKDAIKLRYAEIIREPIDAFHYYLIALEFVGDIVSRLEHKLSITNASFTLKKAPWAR
jgi:hypothetical protein